MARDFGNYLWPVVSFFAVGIAQQPLLMGVTLPLAAVSFTGISSSSEPSTDSAATPWIATSPIGVIDGVLAVACLGGLLLAYFADKQLFRYMAEKPTPLLNTGVWSWSRHPNYCGEISFWTAFGLFAVRCGHSWMLVGTGVNTACLVMVAGMTEKRMLGNWPAKRKKLYEEYIAATPCIFPTLGSVCRPKTKAE